MRDCRKAIATESEMNESGLLIENESLFDTLRSEQCLITGFKQVKKNKGKPGIDGVSIEDFEGRLGEELSQLSQELSDWTYKPSPVRRVEIAKSGGKGVRLLGIPALEDKLVQKACARMLTAIYKEDFVDFSYGYRPERCARDALEDMGFNLQYGSFGYVVEADIKGFFDRIDHDRLIHRLGLRISDKRILRLIGMMLRSGVMVNGVVKPSEEGRMQGGKWKAVQSAMSRVKELTPRGTYKSLEKTLEEINQWYVGWSSYYSLTYYPNQLKKIEAHIRRRLGSRLVSQQKRKQHLYRKLMKRGVPSRQAATAAFSNKKRWALSNFRALTKAYPNSWFIHQQRQAIRSDRKLAHWFDVSLYVRLTCGAVYGPVRTVLWADGGFGPL